MALALSTKVFHMTIELEGDKPTVYVGLLGNLTHGS